MTLGDYAAVVRDIPADTSVDEIIAHFNALYPLDKPDWKGKCSVVVVQCSVVSLG